jgi:hypothetical protein
MTLPLRPERRRAGELLASLANIERVEDVPEAAREEARRVFPAVTIDELHGKCRLIAGVLAGETVVFAFPYRLSPGGRYLHAELAPGEALAGFYDFVAPGQNFPFCHCEICGRIFMGVGNQKYCAGECAFKAFYAQRRDAARRYRERMRERGAAPRELDA